MQFPRGACAAVAAIMLASAASPALLFAGEDWPTRPIRILVGFGAGGGTDVATRIIGTR